MNFFTIRRSIDLGKGFVLLLLTHEYGDGPDVQLPITGDVSDYPAGKRVEINVSVVG